MKKLIISSAILVALIVTYVQIEAKVVYENPNTAVFSWLDTTYDFGEIPTGDPVTHKFTFTNTGDIPLIISSAKASCGCTVADYTKEAIAPGAEGYVEATYNAKKEGAFSKTVTINANTEVGVVVLTLKGEVVAAE